MRWKERECGIARKRGRDRWADSASERERRG